MVAPPTPTGTPVVSNRPLAPGPAANRGLALLREAERLRAQAVGFLAHADENEIAAVRGFLSPSRMIAFETRVSNDDAHNIARAASFVARHSLTGAALASGDVSLAQVDRLAAAARDLADAYERDEMELLAACGSRDVDQLKRFLAQWRWRNDRDASEADAQRSWNNRGVTIQERFDGSGTAQVSLEARASLPSWMPSKPGPTRPWGWMSHAASNSDAPTDLWSSATAVCGPTTTTTP